MFRWCRSKRVLREYGVAAQDVLIRVRLMKGNKRPFNILNNVNAVLKPVTPLQSCVFCHKNWHNETSCLQFSVHIWFWVCRGGGAETEQMVAACYICNKVIGYVSPCTA